MARNYIPVNRNQGFLLPPDMADWIPKDHFVWFLITIIDQLDTTMFTTSRTLGGPGRPGHDPNMLLTVLCFAYANGQRSSRKIEQLCREHAAYRIAAGGHTPDHTVLARFRQEHDHTFTEFFTAVLAVCHQLGKLDLSTIAIDGTKIEANASPASMRSYETLRPLADAIIKEATNADERDNTLIKNTTNDDQGGDDQGGGGLSASQHNALSAKEQAILAACEEVETTRKAAKARVDKRQEEHGEQMTDYYLDKLKDGVIPKGKIPSGVDLLRVWRRYVEIYQAQSNDPDRKSNGRSQSRRKLRKFQALVEDIEANKADRLNAPVKHQAARSLQAKAANFASVTDAQARWMKTAKGTIVGYNAQLAVSANHFIVVAQARQEVMDRNLFKPILEATMGAVKALPTPAQSYDQAAGSGQTAASCGPTVGTVLADAGYHCQEALTCAGPDRLIAYGKGWKMAKEHQQEQENRDAGSSDGASLSEASGGCLAEGVVEVAWREGCGVSPLDGQGQPRLAKDVASQMQDVLRTDVGQALYKRRGATVETMNGVLKDCLGVRRFARRGLDAVQGELHLACAVVNLKRLASMIGVPVVRAAV